MWRLPPHGHVHCVITAASCRDNTHICLSSYTRACRYACTSTDLCTQWESCPFLTRGWQGGHLLFSLRLFLRNFQLGKCWILGTSAEKINASLFLLNKPLTHPCGLIMFIFMHTDTLRHACITTGRQKLDFVWTAVQTEKSNYKNYIHNSVIVDIERPVWMSTCVGTCISSRNRTN